MSWFDQLQKGSFRGVEFLYADSDGDLGRRSQVFEYPGRDLPYVEDLGRRARSSSLEMIVAGPNYMRGRDLLIEALEKSGPGLLIHPTVGQLTVSVLDARGPRETTREGGLARFFVRFIESGENRYPTDTVNARRIVEEKADSAMAAVAEDLQDNLDVSGASFIADDAIAQVEQMASTISKAIDGLPEMVAATDLMQAIDTLTASAAGLIRTPIDLAGALQTIWSYLITAVERPVLALAALKSFWGYSPDGSVPLTTPSRIAQSNNRTSLTKAFTTGATIAAARAASAAEYDSQNAADSASQSISEQIDTLSMTAGDRLYNALTDLRAAVIADLGNRPGLPHIVNVELAEDTPALVLAHRLYGDAERAGDIVARNRINHPGFIPGGRSLEVLSD